jgi:hypothetical protein
MGTLALLRLLLLLLRLLLLLGSIWEDEEWGKEASHGLTVCHPDVVKASSIRRVPSLSL